MLLYEASEDSANRNLRPDINHLFGICPHSGGFCKNN